MTAFFKRFAVKFIEVVGAGIATALSGYLLAHFSGYWSSTASVPPAVQVAPGSSVVTKSRRAYPVSADAKEQRPASAQAINPAAILPARTIANARDTAASRKPVPAETHAAESKPHDEESVEAQVRAALANVDASRPAPAEASPHKIDVSPVVPAVAAQPKPADSAPPVTAIAAVPPAAETSPPPAQTAPTEPEPLTPVEIKSRPVAAAVEATPPVAPVSAAKEDDQDLLSMIKKIPDLLRPNAPAPQGEAPRPPLPVGN
ncbi:MAG: hypothetical protein WBD95_05225 [Xanthobacteraceae bacterium]